MGGGSLKPLSSSWIIAERFAEMKKKNKIGDPAKTSAVTEFGRHLVACFPDVSNWSTNCTQHTTAIRSGPRTINRAPIYFSPHPMAVLHAPSTIPLRSSGARRIAPRTGRGRRAAPCSQPAPKVPGLRRHLRQQARHLEPQRGPASALVPRYRHGTAARRRRR